MKMINHLSALTLETSEHPNLWENSRQAQHILTPTPSQLHI